MKEASHRRLLGFHLQGRSRMGKYTETENRLVIAYGTGDMKGGRDDS